MAAVEPQERTFDALMMTYLEQVSVLKKDTERDKFSLKQLFPVFRGRNLSGLTVADARAYIAGRQNAGVKAATINKEIGLMSAALNWARHDLEWDVPNPFQARRLKEPAGRLRWLSKGEAKKLMYVAGQSRAPHLVDFIRLGLNTGMRSGEMLNLEWDRVDLRQSLIHFRADDQKSGKAGSVPINAGAREALIRRASFRAEFCPDSRWVFCDRKGRRIGSVKTAFNRAVDRAELTDVHPHDLRRTCGSWLVQAGVPLQQVSELLRHSSIKVTHEVYAHLAPDAARDAVTVLDQLEKGTSISRVKSKPPSEKKESR